MTDLGACLHCARPRIVATSLTTGCCDGERGASGYWPIRLRSRWQMGCPQCGNEQVRYTSFRYAIMNGSGTDEFVCPKCGLREGQVIT